MKLLLTSSGLCNQTLVKAFVEMVGKPANEIKSDGVDEVLDGLNLVEFGLQVHLNSPDFPLAKEEDTVCKRIADANCPYPVYSFDDETAIKIDGEKLEIVGEGVHFVVEPIS